MLVGNILLGQYPMVSMCYINVTIRPALIQSIYGLAQTETTLLIVSGKGGTATLE